MSGNEAESFQDSKEILGRPSKKDQYKKILSTVTQSIHRSIDLQEVLVNAVEAMSENIDVVEHVSIYFVEGKEAVLQTQRGFPEGYIEKLKRIPHPKGFTWNTILAGKTRYCTDVDKDTVIGPAVREAGIKSYVSIPLKIEDKTIGCINVHSFQDNAFEENDISLLEVVAILLPIKKQVELNWLNLLRISYHVQSGFMSKSRGSLMTPIGLGCTLRDGADGHSQAGCS